MRSLKEAGLLFAAAMVINGCGPYYNDTRSATSHASRRIQLSTPELQVALENAPTIPVTLRHYSPDAMPKQPLGENEMSLWGINRDGKLGKFAYVWIATDRPFGVIQARAITMATIQTGGRQIHSVSAGVHPYSEGFPFEANRKLRDKSVLSAVFPRIVENQDLLERLSQYDFTLSTFELHERNPVPESVRVYTFTEPRGGSIPDYPTTVTNHR